MKLAGLNVIDLSAFLPGPHLTMMMADHGADVVMVEPANGVGEPTREIGWKTPDGVSVWFRNIARGKRSLKLNLKDPDGQALLHALAKEADVVVEAFRPGVAKRRPHSAQRKAFWPPRAPRRGGAADGGGDAARGDAARGEGRGDGRAVGDARSVS